MKYFVHIAFIFFTLFLCFACNRNNCDDIVCAPCPEFGSYYEVFSFDTTAATGFFLTDLDTILVEQYINGSLVYQFYTFDIYSFYGFDYKNILTNVDLRIPEWSGDNEPDSIVVTIPNLWKTSLTDWHYTTIPTKPSCCGCGILKLDSIAIDTKLMLPPQLPLHIKK
ncbi:MAG: hypothetical protein RLZZ337_194 [Bacteroidota bacterium]